MSDIGRGFRKSLGARSKTGQSYSDSVGLFEMRALIMRAHQFYEPKLRPSELRRPDPIAVGQWKALPFRATNERQLILSFTNAPKALKSVRKKTATSLKQQTHRRLSFGAGQSFEIVAPPPAHCRQPARYRKRIEATWLPDKVGRILSTGFFRKTLNPNGRNGV